jgi:hypothetical protein
MVFFVFVCKHVLLIVLHGNHRGDIDTVSVSFFISLLISTITSRVAQRLELRHRDLMIFTS